MDRQRHHPNHSERNPRHLKMSFKQSAAEIAKWKKIHAAEDVANDPTAHILDRIHAYTELYFIHKDHLSEQAFAVTMIQCLCKEEQEKGW